MFAKTRHERPINFRAGASKLRWAVVPCATAAILALAACGGSAGTKPVTKPVANAGVATTATSATIPVAGDPGAATPSTTTASTTTHSTAKKATHSTAKKALARARALPSAPRTSPAPASKASVIQARPTTTPGSTSKVKVTDDPPIACMQSAGLTNARGPIRGIWEGSKDPGYPESSSLYIDGPYRNAHAADESASTLTPVDHAERGGLYVVSATLASRGTPVHAVALCLDGGGGSRANPGTGTSKPAKGKSKSKPGSYSF